MQCFLHHGHLQGLLMGSLKFYWYFISKRDPNSKIFNIFIFTIISEKICLLILHLNSGTIYKRMDGLK
jgi:hypothetical protein